MKGVKRAYFTYPVTDGLLEAGTIFASTARDEGLELVVNNSQFQGLPGQPGFRDLHRAASFRNFQHLLVDRIFDWAQVGAVHLQTPPYYENVRALVSHSVTNKDSAFLPWGDGSAVIPLTGAGDVAAVAATLLASSGLPSQSVYPLVTETQTVHEIVETLGRVIGRPIRYVPITDEQWTEAVKDRISPHALDHLSHLWQFFRGNQERRQSTDVIREVTGRSAQTLEDFFERTPLSLPLLCVEIVGGSSHNLPNGLMTSKPTNNGEFKCRRNSSSCCISYWAMPHAYFATALTSCRAFRR